MDPNRSSYQDESESRWYAGEQYGEEPQWDRRGDPRGAPEGYRVPDPRAQYAEPRPGWGEGGHPGAPTGPIGMRSGEPLPPLPSDMARDGAPREMPREMMPPGGPAPGPRPASAQDGIYRARRPGAAIAVIVVAVLLGIPALRMLLSAAFGDVISPSGVIGSALMLVGLPLGAMGLYGLATGAARVPGPATHAWLRPPLAYLLVSLVLLVAAGLAAA